MLALGNSQKCSRCIQTHTLFMVHTKRWLWVSGFERRGRFVKSKRELSMTTAEDLIVSCRTQWSEQLNCRWMSDKSWCYEMDVHERGTWQLCHVRRLAFPLNISFYLIWRSKFRILRIKKTRTKVGTLNFAHKFKAWLEENRSYYWQGLVTE